MQSVKPIIKCFEEIVFTASHFYSIVKLLPNCQRSKKCLDNLCFIIRNHLQCPCSSSWKVGSCLWIIDMNESGFGFFGWLLWLFVCWLEEGIAALQTNTLQHVPASEWKCLHSFGISDIIHIEIERKECSSMWRVRIAIKAQQIGKATDGWQPFGHKFTQWLDFLKSTFWVER